MIDTYDIVADAVRKFWDKNYPQPILAIFEQKYEHEDKWEKCYVIANSVSDSDWETVEFDYDFNEGQTDIRNLYIIPMQKVFESAEVYLEEYNELYDYEVNLDIRSD